MKLTLFGNKTDVRLDAVPRVVSRSAGYLLLHGGLEAVLVKQACDARRCHAPPAVRVSIVEPRDNCNLRVSCGVGAAAVIRKRGRFFFMVCPSSDECVQEENADWSKENLRLRQIKEA